MPVSWTDFAGDGLANNTAIYKHPPGRIESYTRDQVNGIMAIVTATTYFSLVYLENTQVLTNIACYTGSIAAITPTSSWLGLWTAAGTSYPPVRVLGVNPNSVFSSTRVSGSPTVTIASGTYPYSLNGRLITGTGIPASTRIINQPSTTTLTLSANATASGTSNLTVGQFSGPKQAIAWTTNGTTTAIPANAAYTRPLIFPYTVPAAGLYLMSVTIAASTMPTLCANISPTTVPVAIYNDAPGMASSHVSGTTNNTAPGVNPVSGGTSADLRTIPYLFAT